LWSVKKITLSRWQLPLHGQQARERGFAGTLFGRVDGRFHFLVLALFTGRFSLVPRGQAERFADHFVALVGVRRIEILHDHAAGELRLLLFHAEHAVPDVDAVVGPHVAVVLAIDGDAEAVNAGQSPIGTAGPVVRPGEARMRDEAAEARPACVLEIPEQGVEVADAVGEDRNGIDACIAQVLFRAQLVADQLARRGQ